MTNQGLEHLLLKRMAKITKRWQIVIIDFFVFNFILQAVDTTAPSLW